TGDNAARISDEQLFPRYELRDRSKLIKTSYDHMVYCDSTDDEEDDELTDDELLFDEKLLQFLKLKDQNNITDEAIRLFNILELQYGICPTLRQLKKLRAVLNKNIPVRKCNNGAYLNVNDAVKLLIHSDRSIIDNASDEVIHIKHNMDGTTIGASTNFLMSTISCVESGINKQSATNVIPLGQFKFNKENRSEIERVVPDEFIDMMEKKLVCLKNLKFELDFQMSLDMKMMWQVMGLYGITGQNKHKCPHCTAANMAEFGKYSAFDSAKGARTLDQQYKEIGKSKPGFGYQHAPFFRKKLHYKQLITDTLHMKLRISDILLAEIISLISITDTIAERGQHLKNVMTFLEQRAKDTNTNHKFTLTKKNEIEVADEQILEIFKQRGHVDHLVTKATGGGHSRRQKAIFEAVI
ncbi:unnamed protein product, partial [Didymodactylos carnosus]